jgi:aerobic-type carbon monoxide dehydrogenase small subunit (CoxS/CutS family)
MGRSKNLARSKKHLTLTVNGKKVEGNAEFRMTLAEFLREELGMTGTKVGCNRAECGSCTVILDGNPVYSCTVLAVDAEGREVQTIEGLSDGEKLHPLQEAFINHDALQCGYCTPGMIMSVKALLDRNPHPMEDDVRQAINGNLCRCGSFQNVIEATLDASTRMVQEKGVK